MAQKAVAGAISFPPLNAIKNAEIEIWQDTVLAQHNTEQIQDKVLALSPMKLSTAINALNALFGFRAIYWRSSFL